MKNRVGNDGAALFEGSGAGIHTGAAPAVEECGSNPFAGNVREPIQECFQRWLNASDDARFTPGAIHTLREEVCKHKESEVAKVIKETFCRSDQEAIKMGLQAAGLLKASQSRVIQESDVQEDDPEQLLREAVLYVPLSEGYLRERIENYLAKL